jgi:cobalt-zinc-cadmium efflux system outer membrane protein
MGLWGADTNWKVASRLPDLPEDEVAADGVERTAVERSLDLAAAKKEVERAGQALGIARPLGFLGEVELGASAEREPEGEWAVGPALSIPIPLFNQGQPAVASAAAELRGAGERYAALAVELRSRVRAAHASVTAARERTTYYAKVILPLRARIVRQTQLQYNAMQIGTFQLLQAKQQQIEAGEAYVTSLRDYWVARAELDQLLSGRMKAVSTSGGREATARMRSGGGAAAGGH